MFFFSVRNVFIEHQHLIVKCAASSCVEFKLIDLDVIIQAIYYAVAAWSNLSLGLAFGVLKEGWNFTFDCLAQSRIPFFWASRFV